MHGSPQKSWLGCCCVVPVCDHHSLWAGRGVGGLGSTVTHKLEVYEILCLILYAVRGFASKIIGNELERINPTRPHCDEESDVSETIGQRGAVKPMQRTAHAPPYENWDLLVAPGSQNQGCDAGDLCPMVPHPRRKKIVSARRHHRLVLGGFLPMHHLRQMPGGQSTLCPAESPLPSFGLP